MERKRLPTNRTGLVHKFTVGGTKGYLRVFLFEDGQVGEIFINMSKSADAGTWGVIGLLFSMALQRGVPLEDICRKLRGTHFPPSGPTGNKDLPLASSVADYIAKWLQEQFLTKKESDPKKNGA